MADKEDMKKLSMEEMIEQMDAAKKVNPLDLSSDQDLSIALMNLISLEEHFFFSGAKTGKPGFYDLINTVREMRKTLMTRIVDKSSAEGGEVWCISKHLLAASMRLMEVGTKALGAGNKEDAYAMFEKSYDLYSLFWGLNMHLIDLGGVHEQIPEFYEAVIVKKDDDKSAETKDEKKPANTGEKSGEKSAVKRLGAWVKNKVNCCLE
ncbi:MAG: hypothetical protein IKP05_00610 [Alphaproteobacteria bacterium]|nr:hypothetical protein [Alphaproteobacteria bacterium]